ncbi:DUF4435 domain-containing protein [Xanthomonas arboricola]|uniref:DUF4435 domain-containing protein n=1 Tax=Xanthomonas arboricola TaxID=56448 RepID=UPI0013E06576|nr:DUF4435 domain-containing protein [Xanthomonas arboricola]
MAEVAETVDALRKARGSAAELKLKLINLRAELPGVSIFVFEGDDDRGVYFSWVRYLDASFRYEPFSCGGKSGVLKLKQAVDRDSGDLAQGTYFFIDRDFDESRGLTLDDRIYMTDRYAVENYLVTPEVLDEVLKIEFHCHGEPQLRKLVVEKFNQVYDKFMEVSADINRELHAARRLCVELEEDLGKKISNFADVKLDNVTRLPATAHEIIKPVRLITENERAALLEEFNSLIPRERFRGKFALSFFMKWLDILAQDRRGECTGIFQGLNGGVRVRLDHLAPATLASRSIPPDSFRLFFSQIAI